MREVGNLKSTPHPGPLPYRGGEGVSGAGVVERGCGRRPSRSRLAARMGVEIFCGACRPRTCCGWCFAHSRVPLCAFRAADFPIWHECPIALASAMLKQAVEGGFHRAFVGDTQTLGLPKCPVEVLDGHVGWLEFQRRHDALSFRRFALSRPARRALRNRAANSFPNRANVFRADRDVDDQMRLIESDWLRGFGARRFRSHNAALRKSSS